MPDKIFPDKFLPDKILPDKIFPDKIVTSGMRACRRRTRFERHGCDVRHAGMPAPDKILKT